MFRRDPKRSALEERSPSGRGETGVPRNENQEDAMEFKPGPIEGVLWRPLKRFHDHRGWLCELFRHDDLPAEFHPVMAYISATEPGVARGPHEHVDQADYFTFIGPSNFKMYLWDNRSQSKTYRQLRDAGRGPGYAHGTGSAGRRGSRLQECRRRGRSGIERGQSTLQRLEPEGAGGRNPARRPGG